MIDSKILYELFNKATTFDIVIGGASLPVFSKKGTLLITLINSNVLSNSNKDFTNSPARIDNNSIVQYSLIQNNYQLDIYKINDNKKGFIEATEEALHLREYLKSFDVMEYLKPYEIEILPCYSSVNIATEFNEQKHLINRAFFEFSLIYKQQIQQAITKIDKIQTNNIIIGG